MKSKKNKMWDIARLKPHPRQLKLFRPLIGRKLEELAETISERGFDHPLDVLPNGTVVDGHQRLAAAKLLGLKEVPVRIRYDLADDPLAGESWLLDTNKHRKHLDLIDAVRVELRLLEIEEGVQPGGLDGYDRRLLKHRLAERLGRSTKHIKRFTDIVLNTPLAVQFAVSGRQLAIVDAVKVAKLDEASKTKIAAEIEAGEKPADVVGRYVTMSRRSAPGISKRFNTFMKSVEAGLSDFIGREEEIEGGDNVAEYLHFADRLEGFARKLQARLTKEKADAERAVRKMAAIVKSIKSLKPRRPDH